MGLITVVDKGARKLAYLPDHLKLKQMRKCRTQIKGEGGKIKHTEEQLKRDEVGL